MTRRIFTLLVGCAALGTALICAVTALQSFPGPRDGDPTALIRRVTATFGLTELASRYLPRDGIRNAGFEDCSEADPDARGNLGTSWASEGTARAIRRFRSSPGLTIVPSEGACMARLSTADGSGAVRSSTLRQRFIVPAGVRELSVDFTFADHRAGAAFEIRVITPTGSARMASVTVDTVRNFSPAIDCFVVHGADRCLRMGWRTATIDLSAFSSPETPVTVELVLTLVPSDAVDVRHVLIDNIRFGTIWIDAKILRGSTADRQRVEAEVRQATRILSQAGLNVRLRGLRAIPDPGNLLDVDITWRLDEIPCGDPNQQPGQLTPQEKAVVALSRSGVASDINVYYVRAGTRTVNGVPNTVVPLGGYALSPDEYCHSVGALTNAAVLAMDVGAGRPGVLAHEIGHLLLSPANSSSSLEHGAGHADPFNFMVAFNTPSLGVMSRDQSANINRPHAAFISP